MEFDVAFEQWTLWTWVLYAFAAYCLVGFVYFWFRLHLLHGAAQEGLETQVERYNKAITGFPNAVYAKMFGFAPIDLAESTD